MNIEMGMFFYPTKGELDKSLVTIIEKHKGNLEFEYATSNLPLDGKKAENSLVIFAPVRGKYGMTVYWEEMAETHAKFESLGQLVSEEYPCTYTIMCSIGE